MKFVLLDNNVPPGVVATLSGFRCVSVRDVLTANATDSEILRWCISNRVDVCITKDKQFALQIASSTSNLKCVLCAFGNVSVRQTIYIFEQRKSAIEYFSKSSAKILKI
jgi:predicted nuclease of predicted toxin-antitoxin system